MKACRNCQLNKSFSEYYRHKSASDGLSPSCKECVKERSKRYRENNPEKVHDYRRKLGDDRRKENESNNNPEGMATCSNCNEVKGKEKFYKDRSRIKGNSSRCKRCQNEYLRKRRRDPDVDTLTTRREWRKANAEKLRKQGKEYKEANRVRLALNESRRRARKTLLPDTLSIEQTEEIISNFGRKCAICGEEYEHLDHFIPLSSGYGGTTKENVIPLCRFHNLSKNNKNPFIWADTLPEYERGNFNTLVKYLQVLNGIADVDSYKAHVYQCFK